MITILFVIIATLTAVTMMESIIRAVIPTAVTIMTVFWDETAYSFRCRYQCFGVNIRLEDEAGANR
jgi:hypothetical protein